VKQYEFLDHTADIQIHCWGQSLEEAYSFAVIAMIDVMADISKIESKLSKKIRLCAPDKEVLFVDFLTEFLGIFDIEELLFNNVDVKKIEYNNEDQQYYIEAEVFGEKYDPNKHIIKTEVKAVTFSYLQIVEKENKVDIWFVLDL